MTPRKLEKLREDHSALRRQGGVKAADLQSLAAALGREQFGRRGKEPTWINRAIPELRPLTIPDHGGRDLKTKTKKSILDQLEEDLDAWEERVDGD